MSMLLCINMTVTDMELKLVQVSWNFENIDSAMYFNFQTYRSFSFIINATTTIHFRGLEPRKQPFTSINSEHCSTRTNSAALTYIIHLGIRSEVTDSLSSLGIPIDKKLQMNQYFASRTEDFWKMI